MSNLKPFKIKPYIVWTFVIALLVMVIFVSSKSNYMARSSMQETVYDAPTTNANSGPLVSLSTSSTQVVPTQIPDDMPTESSVAPPELFPAPNDTMSDYRHANLTLQPLERFPVQMVSIFDADESMYPATLDDLFAASEQQGFMEASVDTIYDVLQTTPPTIMSNEIC